MPFGVDGPGIIERAFQLAAESSSMEEVKQKLVKEGYSNIHAHLSGKRTRHEILARLNRDLDRYRPSPILNED